MSPVLTSAQVCGAKAGRHSYYGGDVCTSCRAFFRRWGHTVSCLVMSCVIVSYCAILCFVMYEPPVCKVILHFDFVMLNVIYYVK